MAVGTEEVMLSGAKKKAQSCRAQCLCEELLRRLLIYTLPGMHYLNCFIQAGCGFPGV